MSEITKEVMMSIYSAWLKEGCPTPFAVYVDQHRADPGHNVASQQTSQTFEPSSVELSAWRL